MSSGANVCTRSDPLLVSSPEKSVGEPKILSPLAFSGHNAARFYDPDGRGFWSRLGHAVLDAAVFVGMTGAGCLAVPIVGCVGGAALAGGEVYGIDHLISGEPVSISGTVAAMASGASWEMGGQIAFTLLGPAAVQAWRYTTGARVAAEDMGAAARGARVFERMTGSCFVAGTPVQAENGPVPIESIAVGDIVWAANPATGELGLHRVTETSALEDRPIVEVSYHDADGRTHDLRATAEHPFWTRRGWVAAGALVTGDGLLEISGGSASVLWTKSLGETSTVYNLSVEGLHTYFVGTDGVLVHNTCDLARARELFKQVPASMKELLACESCANKMVELLKDADIKGTKILFKTVGTASKARAYIWSDVLNKNISEDGTHWAVQIGDFIFDNVVPQGLPATEYLQKIHSRHPMEIIREEF